MTGEDSQDDAEKESVEDDISDIESLRLVREESQAALDRRIQMINESDDMAMRTARTGVVVIGILVTAIGVVGPDTVWDQFSWLSGIPGFLGGVLLFFVVIRGMAMYSSSDIVLGVGHAHRSEVLDATYTEREWLEELLREYSEWHKELRTHHDNQQRALFWTQILFFTSLFLLIIAAVFLASPL